MSNDEEYAISPAWQQNKAYKEPFDHVLNDIVDEETGKVIRKRGQKMLIQRLDMPALLKLGIANEMDFMTKALMNSETNNAQEAVAEAIKNSENIVRMQGMVDKLCVAGIKKPKIYPAPVIVRVENGVEKTEPNDAARQKGLFYVDDIPWEDRQELFSVIFDTEGISDFQQEQEPSVGNVADVQSVQLPADGPVAVRPVEPEGVLPQ